MFKKMDVNFGNMYTKIACTDMVYQNGSFAEYYIGNYDEIIRNMSERITFGILPNKIQLSRVQYPGAPPHTDSYSAALNYYVNADSAETKFWSSTKGTINYRITHTQASRLDLTEIGKFEACTGDVYLLDTHTIHSVTMPKTTSNRAILRCLWQNHPFQSVLDSISIKA